MIGITNFTSGLHDFPFVNPNGIQIHWPKVGKKPDALASVRLCVLRDSGFRRGLGLCFGGGLGRAGGRAVGHVEPEFAELLFAAFVEAQQHVARGVHEPAHGVFPELAGLAERVVAGLRRFLGLLIKTF